MKRAFLVAMAIVLVTGLVLSGCAQPAPVPAPKPPPPAPAPAPPPAPEPVLPKVLTYETAQVGSAPYAVAVGMAEIWKKYVKQPQPVKVMVEPYVSFMDIPKRLNKGDVDMAWMASLLPQWSGTGSGPFAGLGQMSFYLLFKGGVTNLNLYTTDPDIKSIKDWKGKTISGKSPGPTHDTIRKALFDFHGMTDDDVKLIMFRTGPECSQQVKEGVSVAGLDLLATPAPELEELAMTKDIYWIPLTDAEIEAVTKTLPYYFKLPIPAGTYPGQDEEVPTIGAAMGVYVRQDFDQELAYAMVKALFENQEEFFTYHAAAKTWSLDDAVMPQPLFHPYAPSAVKYYKEKGLWTDEHEAKQQQLLKREAPAPPPAPKPAPAPTPAPKPAAVALSWEEAKDHMGETATVSGPVIEVTPGWQTAKVLAMGAKTGEGVNIVINDPAQFPGELEDLYIGKTIAVTGEITKNAWTGAIQIEVTDPSQIVVQEEAGE